jgi:hypothetical protein
LEGVTVRFEVNGTEIEADKFNLSRSQFIRQRFNADPLPPPGEDIFVSVSMCLDNQCTEPARRKLNDERVGQQGDPLSTRIRYRQCEVRLKLVQDPEFVIRTANGAVVGAGHLAAGQWSQWFDLSDYATYPPNSLQLIVEATWTGHAPVMEHFTIPANYMDCLPPPSPDYSVSLVATCSGAKAIWSADTSGTLRIHGNDVYGNKIDHTFEVGPGSGTEELRWIEPQKLGRYTPNLMVDFRVNDQVVAGDHFNEGLSCGESDLDELAIAAQCTLATHKDNEGATLVNLSAVNQDGQPLPIDAWQTKSNFSFAYGSPTSPSLLPVPLKFPSRPGTHWVQFRVLVGQTWLSGPACRLESQVSPATTGQYQDFIGAVPFGAFTPHLEPGKEYFDGARSVMFNVEYINEEGLGEVVFRFNGQEVSGVTTSLFNAGAFRQIESVDGRATTTFDEGVTKLIAYRYGLEQARIFQTIASPETRWIRPLDQPFEHKYEFDLVIYGPPGRTDILVYNDHLSDVHYDDNGVASVSLTFTEPGLVALYRAEDGAKKPAWVTVDSLTFPITAKQTVPYSFDEIGLYHYRVVDSVGQVVAGPGSIPYLEFSAEPDVTYYAQLAYPKTSLFIGLDDEMKFKHPAYWLMPIDARAEHSFEFHLDYYRQPDPDLGNNHVRGDVVAEALYLINGTTSVAQQFPYGRHDGSLPGVKIVGIPNASLVAFCQRPGVHEMVYWGGWENESYYLPERGWVFDQELYKQWTADQHGDCIDAARRVNMLLAREGLRTDHTYRYYGEKSQGYQMVQQHIWSPYNLAGLRPPHLGQLLQPGTVLPYYEAPEDLLFWGWDLEKGGLADGIGIYELQHHVVSLGPVVYGDQTGLHLPQKWSVPEPPPLIEPIPGAPAPKLPIPQPTPEPPVSQPTPEPPTPPEPTPKPTLEPPTLEPAPAPLPPT